MPFISTLNHHDDGNETLHKEGTTRVERSHIEGIALQESFLLPLKSGFAWISAQTCAPLSTFGKVIAFLSL